MSSTFQREPNHPSTEISFICLLEMCDALSIIVYIDSKCTVIITMIFIATSILTMNYFTV